MAENIKILEGDDYVRVKYDEVSAVYKKSEPELDTEGKKVLQKYTVVAVLKSGVQIPLKSTYEEGYAIDYIQTNFKEESKGLFGKVKLPSKD